MIRLYYIRFCNVEGKEQIRVDYEGLTAAKEEYIYNIIDSEKEKYEKITRIRLYEDPYYKEVPNNINISHIVDDTCKALGLAKEYVMRPGKRQIAVEARMFITQICLDMGITHGKLRSTFLKGLFSDGITYHYEKMMIDRRRDSVYDKRYREIKDKVL